MARTRAKKRSNFCAVNDCVTGRARPSEFCLEHNERLRRSPAWSEVRGYYPGDWRPWFCGNPDAEPPEEMLAAAKEQHEKLRSAFAAMAAEIRKRF